MTVGNVLPVPADTFFDPAPLHRGRPLVFLPGRHRDAFRVTGALSQHSSLTWTLDDQSATATYETNNLCDPPPPDTTRPVVLSTFRRARARAARTTSRRPSRSR